MGVRGSAKRRRRRAPSSSAGANTKGEKSRFPLISAADDGNVLERESKRRRVAAAGAADVISGLDDDVLLHVLELLPDAGDAACTGLLSRRWRGLWTRLAALRFDSGSGRPELSSEVNGSRRFVALVNSALALRAAAQTEPAFQHLAISFKMTGLLLPLCFEAAQGWIRDAVRSEVKSFVLELDPPSYYNKKGNKKERFVVALEDLASSSKMETMRLALDGATVRLPAALVKDATFAALADLSLEKMEFADSNLLNRLLSSACCPRLRKLYLSKLSFTGLDELLIESGTLLELSMEDLLLEQYILRLRTPSLRVLRVKYCDLYVLTLSAPRLEEILVLDASQPFYRIDIDGELPCVRSLKVKLNTHAFHDYGEGDDDTNGVGIRLLHCCTSATCLDVNLYTTQEQLQGIDIIKGRIPRLSQVTSLVIHDFLFELHSFGAGISDILRQCCNLKYLRVHSTFKKCGNLKTHFLCDPPDHWNSDEVYLPHLKEAEFTGLVGIECEFRFMQSMLTNTRQLQKATLSFDPKYSQIVNRVNAFEYIQPLGGGMWTCDEAYLSLKWKPCL